MSHNTIIDNILIFLLIIISISFVIYFNYIKNRKNNIISEKDNQIQVAKRTIRKSEEVISMFMCITDSLPLVFIEGKIRKSYEVRSSGKVTSRIRLNRASSARQTCEAELLYKVGTNLFIKVKDVIKLNNELDFIDNHEYYERLNNLIVTIENKKLVYIKKGAN